MKRNVAIRSGLIFGVSLLAVGCDSTSGQPKKQGTYAAARHMQIGSNIPQAANADSVGAKALSNSELDAMAQNQSTLGQRTMGSSGTR